MNKPQSHKLKIFVVYSYLSKANTTTGKQFLCLKFFLKPISYQTHKLENRGCLKVDKFIFTKCF